MFFVFQLQCVYVWLCVCVCVWRCVEMEWVKAMQLQCNQPVLKTLNVSIIVSMMDYNFAALLDVSQTQITPTYSCKFDWLSPLTITLLRSQDSWPKQSVNINKTWITPLAMPQAQFESRGMFPDYSEHSECAGSAKLPVVPLIFKRLLGSDVPSDCTSRIQSCFN